ncbi:MAG: hypothetical protein AAGJ70_11020, partial [Pseudomonadota bacterium]
DVSLFERLKDWQPLLAGIIGFGAIAFAVSSNHTQSTIEQKLQSKQVALALHAEVVPMASRIREAADKAKAGIRVAKEQSELVKGRLSKEKLPLDGVNLTCAGGRLILGEVQTLGVFEANRSKLGLLPGKLSYRFVHLHDAWRELRTRLERLPDNVDCTNGERLDLQLISANAELVLASLKLIDAEMKELGFQMEQAPEYSR